MEKVTNNKFSHLSTLGGGGQLELRVPTLGKGKLSCWCFKNNKKKDICVIDNTEPFLYLEKKSEDQETLNRIDSAQYIHRLIYNRCEGDWQKFYLICKVAEIDPRHPEDGIALYQLAKLQYIFNELFNHPIVKDSPQVEELLEN